jgi:hypothetical protein
MLAYANAVSAQQIGTSRCGLMLKPKAKNGNRQKAQQMLFVFASHHEGFAAPAA